MRIIIYLFICCVLFSCNKMSNKEMMVETSADVLEESAAPIASETFKYETITKQKLQELLDLNRLVKKHPNDTSIKAQKEAISDAFNYSDLGKLVSIESLKPLERVNDSIDKLQIQFISKNSDDNTFKGILTATITSQRFIIDGEELVSLKVTFKE